MSNKKKKAHMPVRLNILFFVVFLLFSALILRLGVVQIVQGEEYQKKLDRTVNMTSKQLDAPRGLMYDRFGNVVVANELVFTVTYTSSAITTNNEKIRVAKRLNDFIDVDPSRITARDKKDYWLLTRPDDARALVTREEMTELNNDNRAIYQLQLDRITDKKLAEITDEELEILAIKREFDGYAYSPQRVKVGVTSKEAAPILEHLNELPGVDVEVESKRKYPYGNTFSALVGRTGAIPKEEIDHFLAMGYDRSDEVGTSFLEQQYEDVLRGKKPVSERTFDGSRNIISERKEQGQRGKDLVLTVDMDLQQAVDQIIAQEVERVNGIRGFIDRGSAYVVLMDPHTGEILALSGYDTHGAGNKNDLGVILNGFEMGSAVKGATVLAGFEAGYAKPNTYFHDRPITIGGLKKSSFGGKELGRLNDLTALERSSNVYMFEIGMAFGNYHYHSKRGGGIKDRTIGFNRIRYYFNQFGLGVKTGIDLPEEGTGFNGGVGELGNLLDFTIGQFSTYTPLQMAQYVSTIANGGYRIQPRLVREIREQATNGEYGNVIKQFSPTVLNRVDMTDEQIGRVQEGFRLVVHGRQGTARALANKPYRLAGKTGTAQVSVNGIKGNNHTFVGYAPYDNPEVAFAVIVPGLYIRDSIGRPANSISEKVLDAYFDLKTSRSTNVQPIELDQEDEEDEE
jgi:penicillin-binding protein A